MLRKKMHVVISALIIALLFPLPVHAHGQAVTISVGRDGYDDMVNYKVDVEAGHEVTITFTYDDADLATDNPHEIQILGAGVDLPTVTVSRDHPVATITFTPTQTGTLTILCIVPCIGMEKLVGGSIHVVKPKEGGLSTSLALALSPRDEESALATVTLVDARGDPISGVPVTFTLHTSVGGELELGSPITREDGTAVLKISAAPGQSLLISAAFEGGNGLGFSEFSSEITMPGDPETTPIGSLSSPTPPPVLALILLIVLGGIWVTYGTVVYQVFRIRSGGVK